MSLNFSLYFFYLFLSLSLCVFLFVYDEGQDLNRLESTALFSFFSLFFLPDVVGTDRVSITWRKEKKKSTVCVCVRLGPTFNCWRLKKNFSSKIIKVLRVKEVLLLGLCVVHAFSSA
ncbi:Uncharacterized protein APZ42_014542 [Daphnia magna]|uniref:Uncharacterized protein n=1 Tax=Daphnia magna TaxID=35525 RepID=A0A162PT02_9CRUS|nr:Uncharacterized protein APZ42_014542 [Daphnia magna]